MMSPSALFVYSRPISSIRLTGTFRCSSSRSNNVRDRLDHTHVQAVQIGRYILEERILGAAKGTVILLTMHHEGFVFRILFFYRH